MGLFDEMFSKKKGSAAPVHQQMAIYAPAQGSVIPLSEFPDPLFSQEALGPGCGILPTGSVVSAPFSGTVTQVLDALHAVGLTSDDGMKVLIHIGVDTVKMKGQGFSASVKGGQQVNMGDTLITFDREAIKAAGYPDTIAVVVTNGDEYASVELTKTGAVQPGEPILTVKK